MSKSLSLGMCVVGIALSILAVGCGSKRNEPVATVDGKVKYQGKAVPEGSFVVFEDKAKGVRMEFTVGSDGSFSVSETAKLPAGTYAVAVTPPGESVDTVEGEDYDKMMGADTDTTKPDPKINYPVPEKFRDPKTSGKTVELQEGSQTIEIDFGK